jgi:hypothetical protein
MLEELFNNYVSFHLSQTGTGELTDHNMMDPVVTVLLPLNIVQSYNHNNQNGVTDFTLYKNTVLTSEAGFICSICIVYRRVHISSGARGSIVG